jgi:hypothetical protein
VGTESTLKLSGLVVVPAVAVAFVVVARWEGLPWLGVAALVATGLAMLDHVVCQWLITDFTPRLFLISGGDTQAYYAQAHESYGGTLAGRFVTAWSELYEVEPGKGQKYGRCRKRSTSLSHLLVSKE